MLSVSLHPSLYPVLANVYFSRSKLSLSLSVEFPIPPIPFDDFIFKFHCPIANYLAALKLPCVLTTIRPSESAILLIVVFPLPLELGSIIEILNSKTVPHVILPITFVDHFWNLMIYIRVIVCHIRILGCKLNFVLNSLIHRFVCSLNQPLFQTMRSLIFIKIGGSHLFAFPSDFINYWYYYIMRSLYSVTLTLPFEKFPLIYSSLFSHHKLPLAMASSIFSLSLVSRPIFILNSSYYFTFDINNLLDHLIIPEFSCLFLDHIFILAFTLVLNTLFCKS